MKKFILLLFILFLSCQKVFFTGRKQLNFISNKILFPYSFAQYKKLLSSSKFEDSTKIRNVGKKLQKALEKYLAKNKISLDLKDYKWEYQLVKKNQINAFCMPGGKVAFFSGILPICKDETGIAVVMAHEISHALANHSTERISQLGLVQIGSLLGKTFNWGKVFEQIYDPTAEMVILKYSRNQENEADKIGLYLMAMAGYDPREAPNFWKRMIEANKKQLKIPEFLSTHPHTENRIKNLEKEIPKAFKYYQEYNF